MDDRSAEYNQGYRAAFEEGVSLVNPHPIGSPEAFEWYSGWSDCDCSRRSELIRSDMQNCLKGEFRMPSRPLASNNFYAAYARLMNDMRWRSDPLNLMPTLLSVVPYEAIGNWFVELGNNIKEIAREN